MKIQQIRNATLRLTIAGKTILTDPVLSPRHGIESFAGIEKNPIVELPIPAEGVIKNIDLVIVSHLHQDHFDSKAKEMLPKDIPLFCQPDDEEKIAEFGFSNITAISNTIEWNGIQITRTPGSHASNQKWIDILGKVSGFIFKAQNEPVIYWAGDCVLNNEVKKTIRQTNPDVILTHSCGAVLDDSGPIVMDDKQTIQVCQLSPSSKIIATHMESLDHGTITRKALRTFAEENNISDEHLLIPEDGETLTINI